MSLYGSLTSTKDSFPTMKDIEESLDGNLCRCTGYRPILDAAKTFSSDLDQINYTKSLPSTSTTFDKCHSYIQQNSFPINQIEFPSKLRDYIPQSIHIKGSIDWYRPVTLQELLHLRHTYPDDQSKLIFGNTTVQIERKFQQINYPRLIA